MQRKYEELEVKHKVTELELMELHKQVQQYENQDYRLSSKGVESLLQRMQDVESVLKNEKVEKKKERYRSDEEDLESQYQVRTKFAANKKQISPAGI